MCLCNQLSPCNWLYWNIPSTYRTVDLRDMGMGSIGCIYDVYIHIYIYDIHIYIWYTYTYIYMIYIYIYIYMMYIYNPTGNPVLKQARLNGMTEGFGTLLSYINIERWNSYHILTDIRKWVVKHWIDILELTTYPIEMAEWVIPPGMESQFAMESQHVS